MTLTLLASIAISMLGGIILLSNLTGLKLVDPDGHSHFLGTVQCNGLGYQFTDND